MTTETTAAQATETTQGEVAAPLDTAGEQTVNWEDVNAGMDTAEAEAIEGEFEVMPEPKGETQAPVEPAAVTQTDAATAGTANADPTPAYVAPPKAVKPEPTPEQIAAQEVATLTALEARYGLTEEETQAMITEPEKVLPKLLARVHIQAKKDLLESMKTVVPEVVDTHQKLTARETEARNAFFTVNDDLSKPEYEDAVLKIGAMYRQVNPTAPKEVAVQKIGELARVALGLPPKTQAANEGTTVATTVTKPFTPTRGGGSSAVASPAKNVWAAMAEEEDFFNTEA